MTGLPISVCLLSMISDDFEIVLLSLMSMSTQPYIAPTGLFNHCWYLQIFNSRTRRCKITALIICIHSGKTEMELPEARRGRDDSTYVDSYPLIWNKFEQSGYVTLFAEDQPSKCIG